MRDIINGYEVSTVFCCGIYETCIFMEDRVYGGPSEVVAGADSEEGGKENHDYFVRMIRNGEFKFSRK